ncbi:MAG: DNA methyltransferase [Promethearchaeota archaeon]|jgi:adenine specific DNA methylase Mod
MVKLTWKYKTDDTSIIEDLRRDFSNFFKPFMIESSLGTNSKNWSNKLFWGDNLHVLYYLINFFKNKIDLIYVDPPFFSGVNYKIQVIDNKKIHNDIAYYDQWNKDLDSYLQMLYQRLLLFKPLLSDEGLLFVHLDWHASHYIRAILDEIFGEKRFVNTIIWYYYNKYSAGKKNLPRAHDNILVYSKSNNYKLNEIRIPRKKPIKQLMRVNVNGVLKNLKDENGHVKYRTVRDKKLDDVWKIPCLQPASKEWTGFPTQKHHKLLERIVELGSNEGGLIADFFCGTGTTLLASEKLKRRWIGCDISEYSIYLTRKRILNYHKSQNNSIIEYPFEILTHASENRKKLIENGFFNKELNIKRIK